MILFCRMESWVMHHLSKLHLWDPSMIIVQQSAGTTIRIIWRIHRQISFSVRIFYQMYLHQQTTCQTMVWCSAAQLSLKCNCKQQTWALVMDRWSFLHRGLKHQNCPGQVKKERSQVARSVQQENQYVFQTCHFIPFHNIRLHPENWKKFRCSD